MRVGIVGHEAAKFTDETRARAQAEIRAILSPGDVVVSGHCHLGGVDIWAEEIADELGLEKDIYAPTKLQWSGGGGFRDRNLAIAMKSDIVYVVVVKALPASYTGMRFGLCYHCKVDSHVKSGGCWTAIQARAIGKDARWIEIG